MSALITKDIAFCQQLLNENKQVAIPTETVYGLAANALNEDAVKRIFETKGRPRFNPLIVHVHSIEQLSQLAMDIPEKALKLAEAFWPGSLTLVLPKQPGVPDIITAGKPTVGIRMPNHPMCLALLRGLSFPVAAPSANPFTRVSPTSAAHVQHYFGDLIPAILDGGPCEVGLESTIVGFDDDKPIIYREGGISIEQIEVLVGKVGLLTKNEVAPQAPGMLSKHYSPKTPVRVSDEVETLLKQYPEKKVGVVSFYADDFPQARVVRVLSRGKNLNEAAKALFATLHELDNEDLDLIIAERFPDEGLGRSINDRLYRAQQ